ncbi:MAG: NAD(P)H-dependent oxidoreductase [Bacteriovorax sp.]|nr:NAD(P)H-dependent oxidoreductase [Bacteriovorax sp.]
MKKICVITASTGKNLELANGIMEHLKKHDAQATLINIVELHLPLYSTHMESHHKAEDLVAPFKHQLDADAFIIVAPEYNGGPPPAFSNFLSWISRSTKNWRDTFNKKTGMIATASGGGGMNVLMILRMQLSFIGMTIIGRQIISTFSKPTPSEEIEKVVLELLSAIPGK